MAGRGGPQGFRESLEEVAEVLERTQSTLEIDPLLDRLAGAVDAAGEGEEVREDLLRVLHSWSSAARLEIIWYFGHRFRWQWLRDEVEKLLHQARRVRDLRADRFFEAMLEAFEDDWEDVDFFPSLEKRDRTGPER